jgi:hypothetical protein
LRTRELNTLANRLVQGLDDVFVKDGVAWMRPSRDVLRGIAVEDSAFDKHSFYVWGFVMQPCIPSNSISFNVGFRVRNIDGGDRWSTDVAECDRNVIKATRDQAISRIKDVSTAADMILLMDQVGVSDWRVRAFCYMRSGEYHKAENAFSQLTKQLDYSVSWQRDLADDIVKVRELLKRPSDAIDQQLELWRQYTIDALGLSEFK